MNYSIDFFAHCLRIGYVALLWCCLCVSHDARSAVQDEIDGDNFEGFSHVACDSGLASGSSIPIDYAAALDLCQQTSDGSFAPGLLDAALTLADGTGVPSNKSYSIRGAFGTENVPLFGSAFVVLSTGAAAAPGQTAPDYVPFEMGLDTGTSSLMPSDWLSANGGVVPTAPGCPARAGTDAIDPVMLTLRIRVPNNARSFTVNANLLTADYPESVCSPYGDVFLVLLDSVYSGNTPNPADKNLARYTFDATHIYPVGVDLALNTGLFTQCVNGPTGCSGGIAGTTSVCASTAGLINTGMDTIETVCGASNLVGGGTGWLAIRGNVLPGETITLRIAIWDTSDGTSDSLVLLDNFQWGATTVTPGTTLQ